MSYGGGDLLGHVRDALLGHGGVALLVVPGDAIFRHPADFRHDFSVWCHARRWEINGWLRDFVA